MSYADQDFDGTEYVQIEGLGEQGSGSAGDDGYALFFGRVTSIGSFTELPVYLGEDGSTIGVMSMPLVGKLTMNASTFQFRRYSEVSGLLYQQPFSERESLSADISSSSGSFTLASGSAGVFSVDDFVFIGNEVMRITGDSGGGTYTISRGKWGTDAEAHDQGSWVYTKNPYWRGRRVKRFILDENNASQLRSTEQIQRISTNSDGTRITVQTTSLLAPEAGIRLNRDSPDYLRRGDLVSADVRRSYNDGAILSIQGSIEIADVFQDDFSSVSRVFKVGAALNKPTAIQVGTALTYSKVDGNRLSFGGRPFFGTSYDVNFEDEELEGMVEGPFFEVAVVSKEMDAYLEGIGESKVSFTRDLDYPYHPLSIIAALHLSNTSTTLDTAGFNVLNGNYWGADFNALFSVGTYLTQLTNLIEKTRWMEIDDLILGWDGEPVDPWAVAFQLASFYGFGFGVDKTGGPTIYQARPVDVGEYDSAFSNQVRAKMGEEGPIIQWESAHEEAYNAVTINVGERPWGDDAVPVTVPISGTQTQRATRYSATSEMVYDAPFIAPGNTQAVRAYAINLAVLLHYANPRLRISVEDFERESLDYDIGEVTRLHTLPQQRGGETLAWLLDSDGEETTNASDIAFTGRLVGRTERFGKDRSFELVMLLLNHRTGTLVRWRAPSVVVSFAGVPEVGQIDVTAQDPSVFGAATGDTDADWLTVGDEVRFWTRSLALDGTLNGAFRVSAVSGTSIILDDLDGTAALFAGDRILRLAPFDPASGTGYDNTSVLTNVDRVYVFLGDDDIPHTIGNAGTEAGDIYGA